MKGWIALAIVGLLVGVPLGSSLAAEAPAPLRARVAEGLAARGGSFADLPAVVPLYRLDLTTGAVASEDMALEQALALLDAAGAGRGPGAELQGAAHRVLGDVGHGCLDFVRHCYLFYTNALGPGTPTRIQDLRDTYNTARSTYDATPARSLVAFPLKGAQAVYLQGRYFVGMHVAASAMNYLNLGSPFAGLSAEDGLPGSGTFHADRAMWGAGVGQVLYIAVPWGGGVVSTGILRGYGAWTFCPTESDPDCNPAP